MDTHTDASETALTEVQGGGSACAGGAVTSADGIADSRGAREAVAALVASTDSGFQVVSIESPFSSSNGCSLNTNIAYATACVKHAALHGELSPRMACPHSSVMRSENCLVRAEKRAFS